MLKGAIIGFDAETARLCGPALLDAGNIFEIQAVACPGPGEEENASIFPKARAYRSAEDLLSKEPRLDFALIASKPEDRARWALRALENRLHVLCLPPFCFSTSEFEGLRQAAAQAERIIFSAQPWERSPSCRALAEIIEQDMLGEVRRAEVELLAPRAEGRGPGATAALGWQAFSMLLAILRRPPLAMAARLGLDAAYAPGTPETEASFQIHFSGATGAVHLSNAAHAALVRIEITGEKGFVELWGGQLRLEIAGHTPETVAVEDSLAEGFTRREWLLAEFEEFDKEIGEPARRGAGLKNARYCVKLLRNAGYSASVNSSTVPL